MNAVTAALRRYPALEGRLRGGLPWDDSPELCARRTGRGKKSFAEWLGNYSFSWFVRLARMRFPLVAGRITNQTA